MNNRQLSVNKNESTELKAWRIKGEGLSIAVLTDILSVDRSTIFGSMLSTSLTKKYLESDFDNEKVFERIYESLKVMEKTMSVEEINAYMSKECLIVVGMELYVKGVGVLSNQLGREFGYEQF